jgi:hypothetical protein
MGAPRESVVFVRSISGSELACGQEVFVPLDAVPGAPIRTPDGRWGHFSGFRVRVAGTLATDAAMTGTMTSDLLADMLTNIRVRAAGVDMIQGSPSGEDLNLISRVLYRGDIATFPQSVADATAAGVATGDVWVSIPLTTTIRDRFSREDDDAVPVAAFLRTADGEAGLRFRFAPAVATASGNSSFKGFLNVVLSSITACDIYAVYLTASKPNVAINGIRVYTDSQPSMVIEPIGGPDGAQRMIFIADPPSTSTGVRSHTGYSNISLTINDQTLYTGRDYTHLADMTNLIDPALPNVLVRTAPAVLPLFGRRADQPLGSDARGRVLCNIGTRTTNGQRIFQVCRMPYDSDVAKRISANCGGGFEGRQAVATGAGLASVIDQKLVASK